MERTCTAVSYNIKTTDGRCGYRSTLYCQTLGRSRAAPLDLDTLELFVTFFRLSRFYANQLHRLHWSVLSMSAVRGFDIVADWGESQLIYLFLRSEYRSQTEKHDSAKKALMLLSEAYLVLSLCYSGWIYEELKEHSISLHLAQIQNIYLLTGEKCLGRCWAAQITSWITVCTPPC